MQSLGDIPEQDNEDLSVEEIKARLEEISLWANQIMSQWDGDFPGRGEDRAMQAEHIDKLTADLMEQVTLMEEM